MLGTHDSAAYKLDFNTSFWSAGSKWELLRVAAKWFGCVRKRIENITITQSQSIYKQLMSGATALDLRVSQSKGKLYTSHTFCCGPLLETLSQIRTFLIDHPSKKIFILLRADPVNADTMRGHEFQLLLEVHAELEKFIRTSRIDIYYRPIEQMPDAFPLVFNAAYVNIIWYNAKSAKEFVKKYEDTKQSRDKIDALMYVVTPPDNLKQLLQYDLRKETEELKKIFNQYHTFKNQWPNIIFMDFFLGLDIV